MFGTVDISQMKTVRFIDKRYMNTVLNLIKHFVGSTNFTQIQNFTTQWCSPENAGLFTKTHVKILCMRQVKVSKLHKNITICKYWTSMKMNIEKCANLHKMCGSLSHLYEFYLIISFQKVAAGVAEAHYDLHSDCRHHSFDNLVRSCIHPESWMALAAVLANYCRRMIALALAQLLVYLDLMYQM